MWPDLEKPSIWDFSENWVWCIVDKLYHRANPRSSFRPIARFVVEIQCLVCDCATPPIIEKLRSKGIAMHAYGVSAYYAWTRNQLNWLMAHVSYSPVLLLTRFSLNFVVGSLLIHFCLISYTFCCTRVTFNEVLPKKIKWPWAGLLQMNVKIEQGLIFIVQNDSRLFFDVQEA